MIEDGSQHGLREIPLVIHSARGNREFTVEVAASPRQQQMGLMYRRALAPDRGMLFPYDPPIEVGFWMKNTLIPLDMIFIRPDRTIGRIATADPLSLANVQSMGPTIAVLEIPGGRASELGLRVGDRVSYRL